MQKYVLSPQLNINSCKSDRRFVIYLAQRQVANKLFLRQTTFG